VIGDQVDASPAQVVSRYLRAKAVSPPVSTQDWFAFIGAVPAGTSPARDNIIIISDTTPIPDGRIHQTGEHIKHPGVQIRVRGKTYDVGWAKIAAVLIALEDSDRQIINIGSESIRFDAFNLVSGPFFMNAEEQNLRQHFALNGTVTLREV
jgi:hypothetical protein